MGTGCEGVNLVIEAWAQWAFCGCSTGYRILDSFCEVLHMACPIVEMLADTATSPWCFGSGGGSDIGGKGKVESGPSLGYGAGESTVCVSIFEILSVVIVGCIGAYGLKCVVTMMFPDPSSCGDDVVKKRVKVYVVDVIVGKEANSRPFTELGQEIDTMDSSL